VKAGGLLTKLPFNSNSKPKIRFFRVRVVLAQDSQRMLGAELQWGDPKAGSETLSLLHANSTPVHSPRLPPSPNTAS
jgi:hypothetical protein